jgi:transposase
MSEGTSASEPRFAAFVAIDWADEKHVWSMQAADSDERQRGEVNHNPEAIESWVAMLSSRFPGQPIAVAVEQSRGPLVFMLGKYEQLHVYPIHPRAAAQFRAALFPSGAKDDPVDADLLLELLVHHRTHLRRLNPDTEPTRLVQHLVEGRRKLVNEKTRQSNRLTAKLKLYFPQMLEWFEEVDSPLVGALLKRWPTLEALQKARPATVHSFLTAHNCRSQELIDKRLEEIRRAVPAISDAAVIQSSVAMTEVLVGVIATLRQGIATFDRQIEQAVVAHPDFAIWDSFPGAGPVLAPRLLAAFGSQRDRYGKAAEMQQFSGIAPVLERSGKTEWVHFRWACPKFLRQTFHEWAGHSIGFCGWARAYYEQQRKHGKDHHAAVRGLAFKWIRIAFRCWKDRIPYDDSLYLKSLRQRGSPLVQALGNR